MTREETWLLNEKYAGTPGAEFVRDCERLRMGEPLAYVIGWVPFLGTKISLDSHPLIPRPETEFWVGETIGEMRQGGTKAVLDLCAGSGCIGVAILSKIASCTVDFVEIDETHHPTIRQNVVENGIDPSRVRVLSGDLFERVEGRYDHILANPPYIDPLFDRTDASVREYEPDIALYGGKGGLEFVGRILSLSPKFLTEGGILYLEHEPEQATLVKELARKHGLSGETKEDQYGVQRYTRFTVAKAV